MFGQVLDKLDSYFGRAFLVARYFPWLLCIAANVAIACVEFSEVRSFIVQEYGGITASKAIDLTVALLVIWIVAYATSPVVQAITMVMEGGAFPDWLTQILVATQARRREKLEQDFEQYFQRRGKLLSAEKMTERLLEARAVGEKLRAINDEKAFKRAKDLLKDLRAKRWLNRTIELEEFQAAETALATALRQNCAEASLLADEDVPVARELDGLHGEMLSLLAPYTIEIAEQLESRAKAELDLSFSPGELMPTQLGNDAAALRSYCETRYGIVFDVFWPRFLLVIRKDAKAGEALSTAKIQLDFSILSLTLTAITILAWIVVIAGCGRSLWTIALVLVVGPLALRAWLAIVHSSYASFADAARSAIDLYRFEVLEALRQPLPAAMGEEKQAWKRMARLALLAEPNLNINYRHPTK